MNGNKKPNPQTLPITKTIPRKKMQLSQTEISQVEAYLSFEVYMMLKTWCEKNNHTTVKQLADKKAYDLVGEAYEWNIAGVMDFVIKATRKFDYNNTLNNAFWESIDRRFDDYCHGLLVNAYDAVILEATIGG
jgi:hypothetical protein